MSAIHTQHLFRVDLDSCPLQAELPLPLSHTDALADEIAVSVRRGMEPAELIGMTVQGYMLFSTRQTLPLSGHISGSSAILPLTESCYAIPGPFTLTLQLISGNIRHTLMRLTGTIARSSTDQLISSGDLLPPLPELLEDVRGMQEATAAALDAVDQATQAVARTDAALGNALSTLSSAIAEAAPAITLSQTGNVITITDAAERPVQAAVTTISALQPGDGTPSPDNVRPIIGWEAARLWHGAAYDAEAEPSLTAELPETIYGGILDWTTGILTVTHFMQTFDGTEEWTLSTDGFFSYYKASLYGKTASDNQYAHHVCSHFKADRYRAYASAPDNSCHEMNNNKLMVKCSSIATLEEWISYLGAQAAAGTPLTIAWEYLPKYYTTVQLTPSQLTLLRGSNAIWSDTGSTSLTYIADTKLYIDNAVTALAAGVINA